jgi:predicted secreted protein
MPVQKSRDLVLHIGDGADPEGFLPIAAARLAAVSLSNTPADATALDSGGVQALEAAAGGQELRVRLDGQFRDQAAEEALRAAAFGRTADNYRLAFPNGDTYTAAFVVRDYTRGGSFEGLEEFSVTLQRSGGGTYTRRNA